MYIVLKVKETAHYQKVQQVLTYILIESKRDCPLSERKRDCVFYLKEGTTFLLIVIEIAYIVSESEVDYISP